MHETKAWERTWDKGMALWDTGMNQGHGTRHRPKVWENSMVLGNLVRVWDKCIGHRKRVWTMDKTWDKGIGVREVSPAGGLWACLCPNFIDAILKSQNTLILYPPPPPQKKKKKKKKNYTYTCTTNLHEKQTIH